MKKLLALAIVISMMLALALPALAAGNLHSKANEWYYDTDEAGTLTVKDNKKTFTYEVEIGDNFLGLQKGYTGQLKFVKFEAAPVICDREYKLVSTATCWTGGFVLNVCAICGEDDGETYGWEGALGHEYDYDVRVFLNESWDEVTCKRCGDKIATASLALIAANEHLVEWVETAKALSANFEYYGIPGNGGNVALIAATDYAEYVLSYAAGLAVVNDATQALKDAYWAAVEAYNLVFAAVDLGNWIATAKELSAKFETAGIPGNGGNVALIAAIDAAIPVYNAAYNWGIGTTAEVNAKLQTLKDAYWAALEAYNLVFAAVDLGNWINTASDRIKLLKEAELWDTEPCQDLYNYMVEYYHNIYLPAYNWGTGTSAEIYAATQTLKNAYWASF